MAADKPKDPKSISPVSNLKNDEILNTFVLDVLTTTERGMMKAVFENFLKENPFDGVTTFVGQILRGTDDIDSTGGVDYLSLALGDATETIRQKCKVRVFDLHDLYPVPCTFGEFDEDELVIDAYPDAEYERKSGDATQILEGDYVQVTFRDLKNHTHPVVLYKYASNSSGLFIQKS